MRMLFEMDLKDYDENGTRFVRPSIRGIIFKDEKIALVHSLKYDYYKFPGGGGEKGEDRITTLIREVKEEAGLVVIPESIREYGMVHRAQKGDNEDIFVQDNYYYICDVEKEADEQGLDDYEAEEGFTLEFVTLEHAIDVNRNHDHGAKSEDSMYKVMIEREARVLEMLLKEKI